MKTKIFYLKNKQDDNRKIDISENIIEKKLSLSLKKKMSLSLDTTIDIIQYKKARQKTKKMNRPTVTCGIHTCIVIGIPEWR